MGLLTVIGVLILLVVVAAVAFIQVAKRTRMRGTMPLITNEIKLTPAEMPELRGKVVIVTGANSGLGKSSTKHFAKAGATVIMACRSYDKALKAKADIVKEIGDGFDGNRVIPMILDLSSLASVRSFAQDFAQEYIRLDILMLNAGVMMPPYGQTKDEIETQMGVNHFGHFYLTELLQPMLIRSQPASIVAVSSYAQFNTYPEGVALDMSEINRESKYNPIKAYGQSKLANVLFANNLARLMEEQNLQIYVNSIHPGAVDTELGRHLPQAFQSMMAFIVRNWPNTILFDSDLAAMNQVYVAVAPLVLGEKFTGRYFVPIGEDAAPNPFANNEDLQRNLWKFTEDILREKGFEGKL